MSSHAKAVGGPLFTTGVKWIFGVFVVGAVIMIWRLMAGIGAVTALTDGYPWGIWIAYDVVTGTALACGGYAVAILTYVLNKGKYHPLVRSAVLTSALGYTLAAVAIALDVGRYWLLYKVVIMPHGWNSTSVLLEVALCVMAYIVVLWIEMAPALIEGWQERGPSWLRDLGLKIYPFLDKILIWLLALGMLLPTMHQSSLGGVMLIALYKVDPLWHTGWLPLLFLLSCIAMGYAVVVFESTISSLAFKRPLETRMLGSLAKAIVVFIIAFLLLRVGDWVVRGQLPRIFDSGWLTFWVLLETALFVVPVLMLLSGRTRSRAGRLFFAAFLMLLAGSLYRFNTYLIAFNPGPNWTYFPSVPEILVTIGIIGLEVFLYVYFVKRFPILAGHPQKHGGRSAPATAGS